MSDKGKVLDISTQDLKKAAPTFQEQSKALGDAAKALKKSLDALGSPWGDDEQGQKFGDAYSPKRTEIEKGVGILVLGLRSIHAAMTDMADGYVDDDKLVEGMFTKVAVAGADGDKDPE
ncbi:MULTISPECIES: WXG100 family type VII secretion target [unclassified Streptomyces]|uniref:WXG100 family type VII secretion target n=1 Tax=unclassified Streptomyces TaxID=2593676 RepID=UPI0037F6E2CD